MVFPLVGDTNQDEKCKVLQEIFLITDINTLKSFGIAYQTKKPLKVTIFLLCVLIWILLANSNVGPLTNIQKVTAVSYGLNIHRIEYFKIKQSMKCDRN